jgi:hypothetical protein
MLENLTADWRVSPGRESLFLDLDFGDNAPTTIQEWLETYFIKCVREANVPEFLLDQNRHARRPEILPETPLVQIFRLSALLPEVIGRVVDSLPSIPIAFREALDTGPHAEAALWVTEVLRTIFPEKSDNDDRPILHSPEMRAQFLDELWKILDLESPNFHPNWVGLWDEFAGYQNDGADAWLALLGKPSPKKPCLCLVLRYPAADVRPLLLPTVLDAGWYAPHFSNPPSECEWKGPTGNRPVGGHPVNFGECRDIVADDRQNTFHPDSQVIMHNHVAESGEFAPSNL